MKQMSEYVSLGHPDKIADYISCYILDRYLEQDPNVRYALEVQIKGDCVNLAGEVSSKVIFTNNMLQNFVREAVNEIGYTREYQQKWGAENTICGDDLVVRSYISQQSEDIARGLKGWGDQGIFFGYAVPDESTHYMPIDHAIAKSLCKELFESGRCGLDIKTQVVADNGKVTKVIVACPLLDENDRKGIRTFVTRFLFKRYKIIPFTYKLIVNGTGAYKKHSPIADTGMTGRKLAVDFYGGNSKVGGGSPWTKDASKADVTLNLCARKFAMAYARKYGAPVNVSLACCIGSAQVDISIRDCADNVLVEDCITLSPEDIIEANGLRTPIYASMCRWGLFGEFQTDKLWER